MTLKTRRWDITEHLARARGMSEVAREVGITRSGLYKALGEGGNPSFGTVSAILKAVGVRMTVATL